MPIRRLTLLFVFVFCSSSVMAGVDPRCYDEAAQLFDVPPKLLKAIALTESGENPKAINKNKNGTEDIGVMQINSSHLSTLKHIGFTREHLFDACTNIKVGAWVLRNIALQRKELNWDAVGAYNAASQEKKMLYAYKIWRTLHALNGMPVPPKP